MGVPASGNSFLSQIGQGAQGTLETVDHWCLCSNGDSLQSADGASRVAQHHPEGGPVSMVKTLLSFEAGVCPAWGGKDGPAWTLDTGVGLCLREKPGFQTAHLRPHEHILLSVGARTRGWAGGVLSPGRWEETDGRMPEGRLRVFARPQLVFAVTPGPRLHRARSRDASCWDAWKQRVQASCILAKCSACRGPDRRLCPNSGRSWVCVLHTFGCIRTWKYM